MATFAVRAEAEAWAAAFEARAHKQMYWVEGDASGAAAGNSIAAPRASADESS